MASHQITREWRGHDCTSTTVLSAYVQTVAARYLGRLDQVLGVDSLAATFKRRRSDIIVP